MDEGLIYSQQESSLIHSGELKRRLEIFVHINKTVVVDSEKLSHGNRRVNSLWRLFFNLTGQLDQFCFNSEQSHIHLAKFKSEVFSV